MPFIPGEEKLTPAFKQKVSDMAGRLGAAPEDLLGVMSFETGGQFSTSLKNRAGSGATGLIQFLPSTAQALGTSPEALAQMSPEQQLDVVERYLTPFKGKLNSLKDAYMAVLSPQAIGAPESTVLFQGGSKAYEQNAGLDVRGTGRITVGDVLSRVRRFLGGGVAEASTRNLDDEIDREIARVRQQQANDITQRYVTDKNAQIDQELNSTLNQIKPQGEIRAPLTADERIAAGAPPESLWERVGRDAAQVGGGIRDAFVHTMQGLNIVGDWMREHQPSWLPSGKLEITIPEVAKAGTVEGDLIRSASQFLTAFLPAAKALEGVGVVGHTLQGLGAGAISDFLAFDPKDPRMSNLINDLAPALKNPVTDFLATNPQDTAAEGRFKRALEGLGLGALTNGVLGVVKAMRGSRQLSQTLEESVVGGAAPAAGQQAGRMVTDEEIAQQLGKRVAVAAEPSVASGAVKVTGATPEAVQGGAPAAATPILRTTTEEDLAQMMAAPKGQALPASVVRTSEGDLQVMYHGSPADFTHFDVGKAKSTGLYGPGIYFTDKPTEAGTYGRVRSAYLDITHPFDMDAHIPMETTEALLRQIGAPIADRPETMRQWWGSQGPTGEQLYRLMVAHLGEESESAGRTAANAALQGAGFDGIVSRTVPGETQHQVYMAFSPDQVHSVAAIEALQTTPTTVRISDETAARLTQAENLPPSLSIGPTQREQARQFQGMAASGAMEAIPTEGKYLHINFAHIQTGDDVKQTLGALAEIMKTETEAQRRGVQTTAETMAKAAASPYRDVERILGIGPGTALNAEDTAALKTAWIAGSDRLIALSREVEQGNLAVADEFMRQFAIATNITPKWFGVQAENARSFRIMGVDMPSTEKVYIDQLTDAIRSASTPEAEAMLRSVGAAGASQAAMNLARSLAGLSTSQEYDAAAQMLQKLYSPQQLARLNKQQQLAAMVAALTKPAQLAQFMRDAERMPTASMLTEAWYGAHLWSLPLEAYHAIDGFMRGIGMVPVKYFSRAMGDPDAIQAANAYVYGLKEGVQSFWRYAARAFESGQSVFEQGHFALPSIPAITAHGMGLPTWEEGSILGGFVDLLGSAARLVGRGLLATNEGFKAVNGYAALHENAFRTATEEGLTGAEFAKRVYALTQRLPELDPAARAWANYQTLSQPLSEPGAAFENLGKFTDAIMKAREDWLPAKLALLFMKIPFNAIRQGLEYTPILGNFSMNVNRALLAGGAEGALARSKMALGTMTLGLFSYLSLQEGGPDSPGPLITGAAPEDPGMKATWERLGITPYSVWVPVLNKYLEYDRFHVVGMPMGLAADFTRIAREFPTQTLEHSAGAALAAIYHNITSGYWLRSVASVVDAVSPAPGEKDPESAKQFEQYLRGLIGGLIPSEVGTVAHMIDPVHREVRGMFDALLDKVPGWSKTLPPALDLWGRPRLRPEPLGPDLVSPIMSRDYTPDDVDNELYRLQVPIKMPPATISIARSDRLEADTIDLKALGKYNRFVELSAGLGEGQKPLKEALHDLMQTEAFTGDQLSDGPHGGKSWMILDLIHKYQDAGLKQLRTEDPDIEKLLEQKAITRELNKTNQGQMQLRDLNFLPGLPAGREGAGSR